MAGIGRLRKDKMAQEFFHIFVILNAFQQIYSSVAIVETHGQAFIQTDKELRYMVDGVPLNVSKHDYAPRDE
ncbi:hypothetical protein NP493_1096g01043 [Ridgeia piscesae]|uniref:Uncharacterized protein n=1 Tax=Ridgeia piscesae TaxID=27915 RepID=A0AAD9KHF2_RIDPI|nr:hypothetical protein NP493_1096g01043 [Ridgeia piscesae]